MAKHLKETERWKKIVQSFADVSVTVLADLVADEFVFGEIARVSREAPVLILKYRERTVTPGGGGNAVMNLASLGVKVFPVGVVGDDEPGELLLDKLREKKIPTSGITRLRGTRNHDEDPHSCRHVAHQPPAGGACGPRTCSPCRGTRVPSSGKGCDGSMASASDGFLISDYGYGAATPQLLQQVMIERLP